MVSPPGPEDEQHVVQHEYEQELPAPPPGVPAPMERIISSITPMRSPWSATAGGPLRSRRPKKSPNILPTFSRRDAGLGRTNVREYGPHIFGGG